MINRVSFSKKVFERAKLHKGIDIARFWLGISAKSGLSNKTV
jgi:hypothetical protein